MRRAERLRPARTGRTGDFRPSAAGGTPTSRYCGRSRHPASRGTRTSPYRGFTLLEVLIAVALLGLALTALVRLAGLEARATAQLREATFAQWVAANALAETRLQDPFPAPGRREGESRMAGRRWRWRIEVQPTDVDAIHRLEVQVFGARDERAEFDEAAAANMTGFAVRR
jgi:general secretion pathway protein I